MREMARSTSSRNAPAEAGTLEVVEVGGLVEFGLGRLMNG